MNKIVCILASCILVIASHCIFTPTPDSYIETAEVNTTVEVNDITNAKPDILLEPIQPIEPIEIEIPEATEATVVEEPEIDPVAKELLACVIYQEAGGDLQCDECRRRVADVVLNRVESEFFPDTINEVLTQQYQYGLYYYTGVIWPERAYSPYEAEAVARAYRIAEEVLSGKHSELYGRDYVWQAEFSQGINTIYCCGIYFGQLNEEGY